MPLPLVQFGIFALVLFGLVTLNFILCIINSCGASTLVNGGFFIGFYVGIPLRVTFFL